MRLKLLIAAIAPAMLLAACGTKMPFSESSKPAPPVPTNVSRALLGAGHGQIVRLEGYSLRDLPMIAYEKEVLPGPQYIISDDPEYIRIPEGMALQENVDPGTVRLYVYNVNGVREPERIDRRISTVIENLGTETMTVEFLNYSYRGPSENYFGIAKNGLYDYFTYPTRADKVSPLVIPPGGAMPLDAKMEASVVKYNELVHALHEFTINQPGRISILQTDLETPSVEALKRIPEVIPSPRRNAGRGKFEIANYKVTPTRGRALDTANGTMQLIVADGDIDPWVRGIDGSTGEELELRGNYGILYDIEIPWRSGDGRGLAVVTWNYRFGDPWCDGMANTMVVNEGIFSAGPVMLPSDRLNTRSEPEAILVQLYPPLPAGETGTIRLTYSPPGASCLPTPLVFIPVDFGVD